MMDP
jgi:hypothetical protein